MKTCTKCKKSKPITEFNKQQDRCDGLQSHCKDCRKDARTENREHLKLISAAYYVANREKILAVNAEYRAVPANRAKAKTKNAERYAENREGILESQAVYNAIPANRERKSAYSTAYYAANKDKIKAGNAARPEANRIRCRNRKASKREAGGKLSIDLASRLIKLQRGKCACGCGHQLGAKYHLDHIMPLALGGSNTDNNIQLLVATCNHKKHAKHPIDFMQQRGFLL